MSEKLKKQLFDFPHRQWRTILRWCCNMYYGLSLALMICSTLSLHTYKYMCINRWSNIGAAFPASRQDFHVHLTGLLLCFLFELKLKWLSPHILRENIFRKKMQEILLYLVGLLGVVCNISSFLESFGLMKKNSQQKLSSGLMLAKSTWVFVTLIPIISQFPSEWIVLAIACVAVVVWEIV